MRDSVRALDRLGETRTGIAALTGMPLARVREFLADSGPTTVEAAPAAPFDGAAQGARTGTAQP